MNTAIMEPVGENESSAALTEGFENIGGVEIYYQRAGHGDHNVLCTSGTLGWHILRLFHPIM
jgi:hypothetical protein